MPRRAGHALQSLPPGDDRAGVRWLIGLAATFVVALTGLSLVWRGSTTLPDQLIALFRTLLIAAPLPAAYLIAAIGLGRLVSPLWRGSPHAAPLQAATGLSLMLTLSHGMGALGLLSGPVGRWLALVPVALGLGLLGQQIINAARLRAIRIRVLPEHFLAVPGAAILFVAACSPPGWLWASEFGGYDALSYHLQLPQEWIASGRISPRPHNVYSFLPSYMESAFVHMAALADAPASPRPIEPAIGLLASGGWLAISCQLLHAFTTLLAAWLFARVAEAMLPPSLEAKVRSALAAAAGALVLATPWTQVVGSLAYNEMAMVALGAGAALAAQARALAPRRKSVLAGWLIGIACGAKPTALLLCGAPVAILLLASLFPASFHSIGPPGFGLPPGQDRASLPPGRAVRIFRAFLRLTIPGAIAGILGLLPWLYRNYTAADNPVFPALTSIFGHAHWSPEQAQRFGAAHSFNGSLIDQLSLIVLPDPLDGDRHRGLLHPQWAALFPAAMLAALAIIPRATRRAAILLTLSLAATITCWLFATHVQSRFLIPCLIPAVALIALAASALPRNAGLGAITALTLIQTGFALANFDAQAGRHPTAALAMGPAVFSGDAFRQEFNSADPPARQQLLRDASPEVFINLLIAPAQTEPPLVLLVGDATPFYLQGRIIYSTTWDSNPLAAAITLDPDTPRVWTASIFGQAAGFALIDFNMLSRWETSGYLDPRLSRAAIERWLREETLLVRDWPERGRAIVRIPPASERQQSEVAP